MRVGRPWRQRTEDLFACEVDYAGKSVLDAGSNVGILAYEISKRGPAFLHLIDGSEPTLDAARLIFNAVETPHRLDLVDQMELSALHVCFVGTGAVCIPVPQQAVPRRHWQEPLLAGVLCFF